MFYIIYNAGLMSSILAVNLNKDQNAEDKSWMIFSTWMIMGM